MQQLVADPPNPDDHDHTYDHDYDDADGREDRQGLPLTLAITVVNAGANCAPVTNASVEIWHCDAAGNYSEYGTVSSSTWLRGIQPVDSSGVARFTTIYPGWYAGRATHIHIEVFVNNRSVRKKGLGSPGPFCPQDYRLPQAEFARGATTSPTSAISPSSSKREACFATHET